MFQNLFDINLQFNEQLIDNILLFFNLLLNILW